MMNAAPTPHQPAHVSFDRVRPGSGTDAPLSLDVVRGSCVALLGDQGCGHHAALLALAGFVHPAAGDILLDGKSLARLSPRRRGVAYVPPEGGLLTRLTLRQNVALGGRAARAPAASVERALDAMGLDARTAMLAAADAPPALRRRAAIARAFAAGAAVIALDHVCSGLDPAPRAALCATLRAARAAFPATLLLATDAFGDAAAVADQVAVLHAGGIVQQGDADTLYRRPATLAVARATGEINLLHGTVGETDEDEGTVAVLLLPALTAYAEPAGCGGAGSAALLAVRPERVAVVAAAAADLGENAFAAVVRDIAAQGEHLLLTVALGEGGEGPALQAKRPAIAGAAGFNLGAQVAVAWQPQHAQAFPLPASA